MHSEARNVSSEVLVKFNLLAYYIYELISNELQCKLTMTCKHLNVSVIVLQRAHLTVWTVSKPAQRCTTEIYFQSCFVVMWVLCMQEYDVITHPRGTRMNIDSLWPLLHIYWRCSAVADIFFSFPDLQMMRRRVMFSEVVSVVIWSFVPMHLHLSLGFSIS